MQDIGSELDLEILDGLLDMTLAPENRWNLLVSFEVGAKEHLQQLALLAEQGDRAAFLGRVHTIKGGFGALGMKSIVALCLEIEVDGVILDASTMAVYVARLNAAFDAGVTALESHMALLQSRG